MPAISFVQQRKTTLVIEHWLLKDALGMITFFPPMIYIQISKKNAFYYPGDSENKQRHFTYILACCYVLAFPSATKVLAFSSSSMQREINEAHFFFLQDIYICKESGKTIKKLDYHFPP